MGIGFPLLFYAYLYGLNFQLKEVIAYSCLCAMVMYFSNSFSGKNNPSQTILETPETIVDGTPIERGMAAAVMAVPGVFGLISVIAIGYYNDGLKHVSWMIIVMGACTGIHLETFFRLKDAT